jgi:hypothetical protein
MIHTESIEELEVRRREEMDRVAIRFKDKQEDRKLQLELAKIEHGSVNRWTGLTRIFRAIFALPLVVICITLLILKQKEPPKEFLELFR